MVSDRFLDSSLAYQGVARGLGIDLVLEINRAAVDGLPARPLAGHRHAGRRSPPAGAARRPDRIEAEGDGLPSSASPTATASWPRASPSGCVLIPGEGRSTRCTPRVMATVAALL